MTETHQLEPEDLRRLGGKLRPLGLPCALTLLKELALAKLSTQQLVALREGLGLSPGSEGSQQLSAQCEKTHQLGVNLPPTQMG